MSMPSLNPTRPAYHQTAEEFRGMGAIAVDSSDQPNTVDPGQPNDTSAPPQQVEPHKQHLTSTWLAWQCQMISGIIHGALYLPDETGQITSADTSWPATTHDNSALLDDTARQAFCKNTDILLPKVKYGPDQQRSCDVLACPLTDKDGTFAVIACSISARSTAQQQAIVQIVKWSGIWLKTLLQQQSAVANRDNTFTRDLLTAIFNHDNSHAAAIDAVNLLSNHFNCERVSLGFQHHVQIRLRALSHIASFDPRSELIRELEAAMEESVDQQCSIALPPPAGNAVSDHSLTICRANTELAARQGNHSTLSLPLPGKSGYIGAITLERPGDQPFSQKTVERCEGLARVIGPALELKQRDERTLWTKALETLQQRCAELIGPNHLKLKLAATAALCLLLLLALTNGNYKVTAPATIEAASRQVLVAPQDGYVKEVKLRAGDVVKKGQLIATLDDRTLLLERQKWLSEQRKIDNEYQQALAIRDRAQISILLAQRNQVNAERQLVEARLTRTELRAPFDGMIVSGDLSQSMGAPVNTGQVLYEVAPMDSFRVALELNEYDMDGLKAGKTGQLMIAALPQKPFAIVLDQVIPVAISAEGRNYFRIEASLPAHSAALQPGMRGVAKVDMGKRKLLWIWTHAVVDRISLWLWSAGL